MEERNEAGRHMRLELGVILTDKMIRNFSDHSANERTFSPGCVRPSPLWPSDFLVEKFDLFLEFGAPALAGRTLSLPGQKFGNIAGLALIILGTAMVGITAARFVITAKNIAREDLRPGTGSRIDIAFAGLLVLMACALFLLTHALVTNALTDFRNRFAVFFRDEITCILSAMQFKSI